MADRLFDLTGKVVLVTGGSRGLGKEIALGCAQMGADVVIASRKYENCVQAAQDLETATGRHALPYAAHIGRWDELDGLVSAAYGRFGKVDVLVNNAGMSPLYGELSSISEQLFDSVINVNFKGPFRLSALVGERMITDGGGSIVNVSSTGSVRPNPSIIPYAAAKAALNSMTEGLAQALGPTVRVNTLMSGAMMTDVAKAWSPETKASSGKRVALGRIGEPHEVVGAALYFASDASSYTTGATLRIDGGIP
ncbi:SDR family NAD(P)-dependent oxidoreductase [Pseudonocardia oroxyli]|nr:glucose 1-dehydrogenase [Pseudonocardia oroxyli]